VTEKVTSKPVSGYMRFQEGRNVSDPRGEVIKVIYSSSARFIRVFF